MILMKNWLVAVLLIALSGLPSWALTSTGDVTRDLDLHSKSKSTEPFVAFYDNAQGSPLIPMINSAKKTLQIEIYQMTNRGVVNAIVGALNRQVKVDIIQDGGALGSNCNLFGESSAPIETQDCQMFKQLVKDVRARGGKYIPFNKSALCGETSVEGGSCFQHGKLVIVDSTAVMASTGNFNSTSLCDASDNPARCNRDYSVVTTDPDVVKTFSWVFANDLLEKRYDLTPVLAPVLKRKLTVSPLSAQPILEMIAFAKKSIVVQNQYLYEPNFNNALIAAAGRGVKVFVMTASPCSFGLPSETEKNRLKAVHSAFDSAGVVSRFFTSGIKVGGRPGYLHAKTIVVDGQVAWVGSINGSTTAYYKNREFGLFFTTPASVQKLYAGLDADFRDPHGLGWKEGINCTSGR